MELALLPRRASIELRMQQHSRAASHECANMEERLYASGEQAVGDSRLLTAVV